MTAKLNEPYLGPDTPGPGSYSLPSTLDETVSFSIAGRPRAHMDVANSTPGPGGYSVRTGIVHTRPPAFSMSGRTDKGPKSGAGEGVGPGQYTPRHVIDAPSATIKGRARPPDVAHIGPGPKYKLPEERTTPAYSLSGRPEARRVRRSDGPGPASVNLRQSFAANDSPRVSFLGGAVHKSVAPTVTSDSPGPGAYQIREGAVRSSRGTSMGKPRARGGRRVDDARSMARGAPGGDSPGPGAYTIPSAVGPASMSHSTSFGPRGGPSAAASAAARRRGSAESAQSTGSRSRGGGGGGATARSAGPGGKKGGAGASAGSSFGRGRLSFVTNTCSPGPAQYSTRSDPINRSTGKTMGPRLRDTSIKLDTPSPGAYSPRDTFTATSAPAVSLSARTKDVANAGKDTVPGPGTYETMRSIGESPVYSNTGAFSFGGRDELPVASGSAGSAVGPGSYEPRGLLDSKGSAPTLKGKWKDARVEERAPGPGAYEPKDPQVSKGGPRLDSSRPSLFQMSKTAHKHGRRAKRVDRD